MAQTNTTQVSSRLQQKLRLQLRPFNFFSPFTQKSALMLFFVCFSGRDKSSGKSHCLFTCFSLTAHFFAAINQLYCLARADARGEICFTCNARGFDVRLSTPRHLCPVPNYTCKLPGRDKKFANLCVSYPESWYSSLREEK